MASTTRSWLSHSAPARRLARRPPSVPLHALPTRLSPVPSSSLPLARIHLASYSSHSAGQKRHNDHSDRHQNQKSHQQKHDQKKKTTQDSERDQDLPAGVSPWSRFMEVLKSEYAKSVEIQENVRELTGTAQGLKDSEAAQKMRQAYTALRLQTLIAENPKLASMAAQLSSTGRSVSDAVASVARDIEQSRLMRAAKRVSAELDRRIGEPIRNTEAYKVVEDTVDFSQGALRYGGYIEKAERRRRRQKRLERLGKASSGLGVPGGPGSQERSDAAKDEPEHAGPQTADSAVAGNPAAAPALVLHATANEADADGDPKTARSRLASLTPEPLRRAWANFQATYEDSDHPVVASMRTVTGAIGRVFSETETARVVGMIKEMDAGFEFDGFLRDLREYIVPEIVDAYVDGDLKSLRLWTSEGAYNVITAPIQMYLQRGLRPESQVIDLKGIDIMSAKILHERELPVFVVAFRTHETHCFANPRTGAVEVGDREEIQQVQYVLVMTREASETGNVVTGGWKVVDMARRGTVAFL